MKKYIKSAILPISDESEDIRLEVAKSSTITEQQAEELSKDSDTDIQLCLYLNPNVPQTIKDKLKCPKYIIMVVDNEHYGHWSDERWMYRVCDNPEENIVMEDHTKLNSAYWYVAAKEIAEDFENSMFQNVYQFIAAYDNKYDEETLDKIWKFMNTPDFSWNYNSMIIHLIRFIYPDLSIVWGDIRDFNDTRTVFYNYDNVNIDVLSDWFNGNVYDIFLFPITPSCLEYIGEESWFQLYDCGVISYTNDVFMTATECDQLSTSALAKLFGVNEVDCLFVFNDE